MNIAIAITLYRRPAYTKQVLDALLECYGIEDIPVYLSQDWSFEMHQSCEAVKRLALDFQKKHTGPSQYSANAPKLGIDLNKLAVIPKAFAGLRESGATIHGEFWKPLSAADFVILIEDDTVPSRDCIRFFQNMAERYKDDKRVWSVCGYNRITDQEFGQAQHAPYATALATGFCPWIWGTWTDRWQEFYADGGEQYKADTKQEANGLFDHWLSKKERLLVAPIVPRTRLIGELQAEHTTPADWERERNEWGAWDLELSDLKVWPVEAGPASLLHAGTARIENVSI